MTASDPRADIGCCLDVSRNIPTDAAPGEGVFDFGRTVDRIPHLVENWEVHHMRYEWQALSQFVKDWRDLPELRGTMLANPIHGSPGDPKLAYIAATVHALCLEDNWEVPDWVPQFVADELFTGRFTKEHWESNTPSIFALKKSLHPSNPAMSTGLCTVATKGLPGGIPSRSGSAASRIPTATKGLDHVLSSVQAPGPADTMVTAPSSVV